MGNFWPCCGEKDFSGNLYLTSERSCCIISTVARTDRADGPVVQLVRTLACHARGRRFEPVPGRHAAMAQAVERILGKDEVSSSNLDSSSRKCCARKSMALFVLGDLILSRAKARGLGAQPHIKRRRVPENAQHFWGESVSSLNLDRRGKKSIC